MSLAVSSAVVSPSSPASQSSMAGSSVETSSRFSTDEARDGRGVHELRLPLLDERARLARAASSCAVFAIRFLACQLLTFEKTERHSSRMRPREPIAATLQRVAYFTDTTLESLKSASSSC
eukprot:809318-Pleurochrysis_carterae.AAC.1